jgi:hypothetical protein
LKKLLILFISITMVFVFSAAALASVTLSGTLSYHFDADNKSSDNGKLHNDSKVDFFRISVATDKSFDDDRANVYLNLQCQTALKEKTTTDNPVDNDHMLNWNIYQYGYTYNITDRLMVGMLYDAEGVTLSSGILASDWQWVRGSYFNSLNVIKLVVSPFDTVTAGIYYEPISYKYVFKGEYKISGLKIGAGYTNSGSDLYNVYSEILPTEKSRIYLDYYSDDTRMLDASVKFDPITLALLYSNHQKTYLNLDKYTIFNANTADFSVDYAFTEKKSITGGVVWNLYYDDLDAVYGKYNIDRGYVEVKQQSTTAESLSDTHILGGYRFDGTNLFETDYNVTQGNWWARMVIYF